MSSRALALAQEGLTDSMTPSLVGALGAVLLINLILSGDNAVVIGMAVRGLPPRLRQRAIAIGSGLAVVLRLGLTIPAGLLFRLPLVHAGGGALLAWIAYRLLTSEERAAPAGDAGSLLHAVQLMVLADVVMSLDNILAVAAVAERSTRPYAILVLGLAISVPIVLVGGSMIGRLMHRLPIVAWAGAALLGYTAGALVTEDRFLGALFRTHVTVATALPVLLAVAILALAWRHDRQTLA